MHGFDRGRLVLLVEIIAVEEGPFTENHAHAVLVSWHIRRALGRGTSFGGRTKRRILSRISGCRINRISGWIYRMRGRIGWRSRRRILLEFGIPFFPHGALGHSLLHRGFEGGQKVVDSLLAGGLAFYLQTTVCATHHAQHQVQACIPNFKNRNNDNKNEKNNE